MSPHLRLAVLLLGPVLLLPSYARGADGSDRPDQALPAELAPLEYLVGQWKGQGVPTDDPSRRFRGWTETHTWAWAFAKGKPVGLSLSVEGGKGVGRATLTYDPGRKQYRLRVSPTVGNAPELFYVGSLDSGGKRLSLESQGKQGVDRLVLRANSNYLRYTLVTEHKSNGASTFSPRFEVGLTRRGESLAAGPSATERPRCVVTGGAATMSVSYQGRSFPLCCTGCRDEFNDNPEKYLKKLAARTEGQGDSKAQPGTSKVNRFEDAFADDVPDEKPPPNSQPDRSPQSSAKPKSD